MKMILVIGERPEHASALAQNLGLCGIEAIPCARDWKLAVRCLTSHPVKLILANVDNTAEAREFFHSLEELTEAPIIALGPASDYDGMVWYLEHGAADYMAASTPFNALAAKISALLREGAQFASDVMQLRDLRIDLAARLVMRGAKTISLTPIEFKLLSVLAQNVERTCSRRMLLEQVWGKDFEDCAHYLRLYVGYIRQKLEPNPARPRYLVTDWGYGYRLTDPQRNESRAIRHRIAAKRRASAERRTVPSPRRIPSAALPG